MNTNTEERVFVHEETSDHLVVVGSSAGGIEALGVLVGSLPESFPAPLVLAQHLDPRRPSHLATILERRSKLPIVTVSEPTRLERGTVYVVPSNQHVVIRDGSVRLEGDHDDRPRPSVDRLLSTAAESYGDRLFAVILTGSGSDGAAGAVDVKAAGGTVIIQNPATAAHPSMPQALPPTMVDHVEDLEQIGPLLTDLLKPPALDDRVMAEDAFAQILQIVGHQSAIDFRQYKPSTILRRISRRMAIRHTHSLGEYRDYLEAHPAEIGELAMSLLIKVTGFFRDREAFERLRREVFPSIIAGGRERGNLMRLWSAGCATGEEAYSLAFLASDVLGSELPEWNVKVFATDLDESAIAFARRGVYPLNTTSDMPQEFRTRFFETVEGGARVAKTLRQMVIFGTQDLGRGAPFPRMDLVLCRNLLIYFKPELQRDLLDLFAYSLQPTHGYLFLGKAETARPSNATFEMVNKKWRIYRCVTGPRNLPGRVAAPPAPNVEATQRRAEGGVAEPLDRENQLAHIRRLNEVLLRFLGAGAILIDSSYRILSMNSIARRILDVRETGNDQDFLHTVRELPYGELRNAIDRVFRERVVVTLPEIALEVRTGEPRWVSLNLAPSHLEGTNFDNALITVQDATEIVLLKQRLTALEVEHRQLGDDLSGSNQKLGELNQDLQDANEELQASNEEMMLTQEELQATNEEFEATNEELQATNEELETNNEELQATNEELETTNEELVARSSELQELTQILTLERLRLAEMVELAPFHIGVVSGPAMIVESMNVPAGQFGAGFAKGVSLEDLTSPDVRPLVEGVREAYRTGRPWASGPLAIVTQEQPGEAVSRVMEFTVIPNRNAQGVVIGAVLYGMDVTDIRGREEQGRLERYRLMIEHAHQVALALFDARSGVLLYASPAFAALVRPREPVAPLEAGSEEPEVDVRSIAGRRWQDLGFLAPEEARRAFEEAVEAREPRRLSQVSLEVGLRQTVWDCSLIPVREPHDGSVRHVVVSAVDVTDQERARAELERADRLKDQFLSLASHELRTPLMPLTMYAEVLKKLLADPKRDPSWEQRMVESVAKFQAQIAQLARLTDDLMDVARLESGRLSLDRQPVDLKDVLRRAQELHGAQSPKLPLNLTMPEQPGQLIVQGDEQRLLQLFGNLLSNAGRHASGSRSVELSLAVDESEGKRKARVEVRDQGPGISAERMGALFSPFTKGMSATRASRAGLGLGLFISRGIVEQHGGTIRAESKEGQGTTFIVELPLTE